MKNLFDLTGKVALITGASKGIGKAIAEGFAAHGAQVVVSSRRQESVDAVAAEIVANGGQAVGIAAKIGNYPDTRDIVDKTIAAFGGIDIIVNNAATNPVYGSIEEVDDRAFDKIMSVNVQGPLELCKRALPFLRERGGGSIINISSIGGIKPEEKIGMYSTSKAALINMSQAMAQDWGADNIRVNVIAPGLIKTKFSQALWQDEATVNRFNERIPMGRLGEPEDLAGMAVFLASDAASYCTGGVYMVDGGYIIK